MPSEPVVIGLWHQDLPACLAAFKGRNIAVLISRSRDGGKFAKLSERLGYNVFRGSSSRGQSEVRHLLKSLRNGFSAGMALDGPKGPALTAKPGAEWLAKKTGVPLVKICVKYSRAFRLKSWDKTFIPLPFSNVYIDFDQKSQDISTLL
uniref:Putative lipoprotein n=1 Tax=uncultured bacterium contig00085 TaxID=1181558 RepID=A0A806JZ73_9BACT|nr:putative lipoprotein [uncultured bacterium contig00085]